MWGVKSKKKERTKNRKKIEKEGKRLRFCSVRKDEATGIYWPADAGMKGVGSRKILCPVKKAV